MVKGSRVVGYARVSTHEQADSGLSVETQRAAIEAECDRRGWHLVDVVTDAGYSGKNTKRPGLERVMSMLDRRQVDGVVSAKLDRLSRSVVDFGRIIDRSRKVGWFIVALDFGLDTTTANGKLVANVLMSVAEWEREAISERTRTALAAKKAQGHKLGRPDLGTTSAAITRRIVRARGKGDSLRTIAAALNAAGVPTSQGGGKWYASSVKAVLDRTGPA